MLNILNALVCQIRKYQSAYGNDSSPAILRHDHLINVYFVEVYWKILMEVCDLERSYRFDI